ncbi:unnamed protein product, partial [Rotaria sp. Silwood2]
IEQMIVEPTNEKIIGDIIEQIQKKISDNFSNQAEDSNKIQSMSIDIDHVIDSDMNHIDANYNEESIHHTNNESISTTQDVQMDDINGSLNEHISMETDQQSSIFLQSKINDDIVKTEVSTANIHQQLCTWQCHQIISTSTIMNSTNEYILFEHEQASQQIRQEEEQKTSLNNNFLRIKCKSQQFMNYIQKQKNINKIDQDQEQQTIPINQQDLQTQTDLLAQTETTTSQQQMRQEQETSLNDNHRSPVFKRHYEKQLINKIDEVQQAIPINQQDSQTRTHLITTTETTTSQQQMRQEQEQETSLNNNHRLPVFKRHYEKQLINKIDEVQQAIPINQQDSQTRTDLITTTETTISQQQMRQEQEQETSLNNNHRLPVFKRHYEKQLINKIDEVQQA